MKKIFLALQLVILSLGLVCISGCPAEAGGQTPTSQPSTTTSTASPEAESSTQAGGEIATTGVMSETSTATTLDAAAVQLPPDE